MSNEVELSRVERLILWNQYAILEKLDPGGGRWSAAKEALADGYELHYGWYMQHITEDTMSPAACREVLDILGMFQAIQDSLKEFPNGIDGLDVSRIDFRGFDGNEEGAQYSYFRFLREEEEKFLYIKCRGDHFNSHMPVLPRYRQQLLKWKGMGSPSLLSESQLRAL